MLKAYHPTPNQRKLNAKNVLFLGKTLIRNVAKHKTLIGGQTDRMARLIDGTKRPHFKKCQLMGEPPQDLQVNWRVLTIVAKALGNPRTVALVITRVHAVERALPPVL